MALTFYYGSGSPYSWRVWFALEHKRIPYELKILSFSAGDLKKPEYAAVNPRRKVPAIVDNGFALHESSVIIEYLDEQYPNEPKLFPGDVRQRALTRRMVREADEYFAAAMETLVDNILFTAKEEWSEPAIAKARDGLRAEFAIWEQQIAGDYLAGALSAADFTLYPAIALLLRIEMKKPDLDIRSLIGPKIAAWMKRIEALPFFEKTIPPHWKTS
jgi:glutathione S-transferase